MNHPKCKDCKHFNPNISDWDNPLNFGECNMIAESWEMSKWNHEKGKSEFKPHFEGHLASVCDGSAYSAGLNVHPDFYCAMHSSISPDLKPYSEYSYE